MSKKISLEKALAMVEQEYERAKRLEYVKNPLAFAMYKVWKRADEGTMWNINATPPTNADYLRSMADEELAGLLYEADSREGSSSLDSWLEWLQQPYKENEDG